MMHSAPKLIAESVVKIWSTIDEPAFFKGAIKQVNKYTNNKHPLSSRYAAGR